MQEYKLSSEDAKCWCGQLTRLGIVLTSDQADNICWTISSAVGFKEELEHPLSIKLEIQDPDSGRALSQQASEQPSNQGEVE